MGTQHLKGALSLADRETVRSAVFIYPSRDVTVMAQAIDEQGVELRIVADSNTEVIRRFLRFFGVVTVQRVIDQEFTDDLQTMTEEPVREPIPNRDVIRQAILSIGDPLLPLMLRKLSESEIPVRRSVLAHELGVERYKVSAAKKKLNNWFRRNHMGELIRSKRVRVTKGWARNYELAHPRFREWIPTVLNEMKETSPTDASSSPGSSR